MSLTARARRALFGPPKDVKDPHALHQLALVALLAWVGLGADGLSSAYGPEEALRQLGEHRGLAVPLALATALTVVIISYAYSRVIEHFPWWSVPIDGFRSPPPDEPPPSRRLTVDEIVWALLCLAAFAALRLFLGLLRHEGWSDDVGRAAEVLVASLGASAYRVARRRRAHD